VRFCVVRAPSAGRSARNQSKQVRLRSFGARPPNDCKDLLDELAGASQGRDGFVSRDHLRIRDTNQCPGRSPASVIAARGREPPTDCGGVSLRTREKSCRRDPVRIAVPHRRQQSRGCGRPPPPPRRPGLSTVTVFETRLPLEKDRVTHHALRPSGAGRPIEVVRPRAPVEANRCPWSLPSSAVQEGHTRFQSLVLFLPACRLARRAGGS